MYTDMFPLSFPHELLMSFLIINKTFSTYTEIILKQLVASGSVITSLYSLRLSEYLRNRKHFPCFYRVIETRVKVWEKREIAWEHEHEVRVFPRNFEFLPNFHKCFYKLYRNTEKMFSISFIK